MTSKIDHFIVKPKPREKAIPYHDDNRAAREIGAASVYMDNSLVPEADVRVSVRGIKQVPPDYKAHVAPHKHEVSQVYGVIGDLTVEFVLEGERREVTGPASIFIPAGMMHSCRPVRGSGYSLTVYCDGEYKASAGD